jgi:glycosyltransferase involved in cell wall biosynthesis
MKILQIANGDFFSTYGGGQVYVKNLVDEMICQGLDVVVLSFVNKNTDETVEKLAYRGIFIYQIYWKNEKIIENLIRQINPAVIHVHTEKAMITGISMKLSIPCVVTAHHGGIVCPAGALMNYRDEICHVPLNFENCLPCVLRNIRTGLFYYPLLKNIPLSTRLNIGNALSKFPFIYFVTPIGSSSLYIERKQEEWGAIIENTDKMIAPSYAIADNMILNGFPKEKIEVIPHGIPVNITQACPNDERICHCGHDPQYPPEKIKFFYVGRIGLIKGIHHLLNAFSQLDASACELHIIGDISGGDEQKIIRKYRKKDNIFFYGKINPEEVSSFIYNFDVLVHPTICLEVFGLNIGEALLEGKPVIATRCGGPEMQIQHGENGLLIEPNNVNELREAMQWMMKHPEEIKRMSGNTTKHVVLMNEHVKKLVSLWSIFV